MRIAILKESAPGETRVAATPESVKKIAALGHQVVVQTSAGAAASMPDAQFKEAGAEISADGGIGQQARKPAHANGEGERQEHHRLGDVSADPHRGDQKTMEGLLMRRQVGIVLRSARLRHEWLSLFGGGDVNRAARTNKSRFVALEH